MLTIIEKAQKEISETGSLSVAARQQLWLALGPAEVNEQHPGPLHRGSEKAGTARSGLREKGIQSVERL